MSYTHDLCSILSTGLCNPRPVIPYSLELPNLVVLDLSAESTRLAAVDLADVQAFSAHVLEILSEARADVGVGRYAEPRVIYRHSSLFDEANEAGETRTVHLGVDLFVEAGTAILAPLAGSVHSLAVNDTPGDYGPTIVLEHELAGRRFFTLYGHLSTDSLSALEPGHRLAAGACLARLGTPAENGGWPPHLHFQIIADMGEHTGNFPGVAAPSETGRYLGLCPDPNLVLRLPVETTWRGALSGSAGTTRGVSA